MRREGAVSGNNICKKYVAITYRNREKRGADII